MYIYPDNLKSKAVMWIWEMKDIGNKSSKKFHRSNWRTLPAEKNHVSLASYEEAINSGYIPCRNCIGK